MKLRQAAYLLGLPLPLLYAGCNMPGFEPDVEELVIPEAPQGPEFGPVDPAAAPAEVQPEDQAPPVMEPV